MMGLAVTILLATLEIAAFFMIRSDDLMADADYQVPANRREEAGIQAEVIVDAERPEVAAVEPAAQQVAKTAGSI